MLINKHMKNISSKNVRSFLVKNYWTIDDSTPHNKISFKESVIINNEVKFKTAKMNIHLKRDPVSEKAIKQIKEAFETILEKKISKADFSRNIKNKERIINKE